MTAAARARTVAPATGGLAAGAAGRAVAAWAQGAAAPDHDLVRGLAGVGIRALARGAAGAPLLEAVLAALARTRTHPGDPPPANGERPAGRRDPGLAHGGAGVVAFLASAVAAGAGGRDLPAAAARSLAAADVPVWAAWCGGAPGVAAALARAADVLGDGVLRAAAVRTALATPPPAAAQDAGLCDGAAGAALALTCAARHTGDPAVGARAAAWSGAAARLDAQPAGLLGGSDGVALARATLARRADPAWLALLGPGP